MYMPAKRYTRVCSTQATLGVDRSQNIAPLPWRQGVGVDVQPRPLSITERQCSQEFACVVVELTTRPLDCCPRVNVHPVIGTQEGIVVVSKQRDRTGPDVRPHGFNDPARIGTVADIIA